MCFCADAYDYLTRGGGLKPAAGKDFSRQYAAMENYLNQILTSKKESAIIQSELQEALRENRSAMADLKHKLTLKESAQQDFDRTHQRLEQARKDHDQKTMEVFQRQNQITILADHSHNGNSKCDPMLKELVSLFDSVKVEE